MTTLLRRRNFALLWFGGIISLIGDQVLVTALPFFTYRITGSVVQTGALSVVYFLPAVLLGSVAGVFVDRWDLKRTITRINLAQAAGLLPLLLVHSAATIWIIYLVALSQSGLSLFIGPATGKVLPQLVERSELSTANALSSIAGSASRLIGPPVGGILLAWSGLPVVTAVDGLSFVIAGFMVARLTGTVSRAPEIVPVRGTAALRWLKTWRQWLDGLSFIRGQRFLLVLFLVGGLGWCADAFLGPLIVPFVHDQLRGSATTYGWISASTGAGSLLGAALIGLLRARAASAHAIALGLLGVGTMGFIRYNLLWLPVALGTFVFGGMAGSAWTISRQTLVQLGTPDEYRGRVLGASGTSLSLMLLAGTIAATVLGGRVGVRPVLNLSAFIYIVAGACALWLLTFRRSYVVTGTLPGGSPSSG